LDLAKAITLGVQLVAIMVLIAMVVTLVRAVQIEPTFRGRPGGSFMRVIIGVVFGFTIAQAIAVLNVFGILVLDFGNTEGLHNSFRLLQQVVIIVTCVWTWWKLARYM
jgi:predicted membrane protein